jgi:hypothetical protein
MMVLKAKKKPILLNWQAIRGYKHTKNVALHIPASGGLKSYAGLGSNIY